MSGKVGLILLAGYRRGYDRRAEAIADIVLNYQHGSYPALLGADDGTQISVVYISRFTVILITLRFYCPARVFLPDKSAIKH